MRQGAPGNIGLEDSQIKPAAAMAGGDEAHVTTGPKAILKTGELGNFEPKIVPGSGPGKTCFFLQPKRG